MADVYNESAWGNASHDEQQAEMQRRYDEPETKSVVLGLTFLYAVRVKEHLHWDFQCKGTWWQEGRTRWLARRYARLMPHLLESRSCNPRPKLLRRDQTVWAPIPYLRAGDRSHESSAECDARPTLG
jgi:hypothetical protein